MAGHAQLKFDGMLEDTNSLDGAHIMMHTKMENSVKANILLNLNLKLPNSETTIFGLHRLGLPAKQLLPVF